MSAEAAAVRGELPDAAASATDGAIRDEQARLLRQAVERLPDDYGEVVRLRQQEQMSFEEIGRRTGRTAEAARKVWMRAIAEVGRGLERTTALP